MSDSREQSMDELRRRMIGRRVMIVHYGEDTPLDDGYRPLRYGQLAEWLMHAGAEVVRVSPSFSHATKRTRSLSLSGKVTEEGRIELVETVGYDSHRSLDRLRFLRDFQVGVTEVVGNEPRADLYLVGYPPPGLVRTIRRLVGPGPRIVADIRDLWPDAWMPSGRAMISDLAARGGQALARELMGADGVVANSPAHLARAPEARQLQSIPISVSRSLIEEDLVERTGALVAVFVGSFTQLFDFDSMIEGWRRFMDRNDRASGATTGAEAEPVLHMIGGGPLEDHLHRISAGVPGIDFPGMVPSNEVPSVLSDADVGVVPLRGGQGTTWSNKLQEYVGTGAYSLHTLLSPVAEQVADIAHRVDPEPASWAAGFERVDAELANLRAGRAERRRRAVERFGQDSVERIWLSVFADLLETG